jgi:outer membrane receptor protein involved in Fe transport
MNRCSKRSTLLLSTAFGLLLLPGAQAMAQTANPPEPKTTGVQEVIVTAQKRTETVLNVPMGLTAISGKQLVSQQAFRLEDFVGQVPGLNLTNTLGGTQLVIRGIATSYASVNAPVATYIDDTPIVGIGPFSGGSSDTPNIDTFDVSRIEVLKGPQGTLYGADALGGILKYVTNAPDLSKFSARAAAGTSFVDNGGEGYDLHGMVNAPLGNNLAFRVSAYDNNYPGFIDDPSRGLKDINGGQFYGGHAALLWQPTANFSVKLNALYQANTWNDLSNEDVHPNTLTPIWCTLCQERDASQPGFNKLQYYNATINWDLGWAKLLSSTTYYDDQYSQHRDLTVGYGAIATYYFVNILKVLPAPGPYGFWAGQQYHGTNWVQETRLSSNDQGPFQWQVGVYYTSKAADNYQPYFPIDVTNKKVLYMDPTYVGTENVPTTYQEIATYANLDYHITPTFDVAVGGRYSYQDQTFSQIGTGDIDGGVGLPKTTMNESVFTYSADARWHFTPQSMLYGRVATGFVPGGPNDQGFTAPVPHTYGPSTTIDYEVGVKSALLDNHLTIDVDAFEIDWQKIQLVADIGGYSSLTNGGTATSRGFEWNFTYIPVRGLTLDFNGAYTDAYLSKNAPASVGGLKGDQLPVTPMWQMSASGNYEWPLWGDISGLAGINWRYTGNRYAEFEPAGQTPRQQMPSYQLVDLRAGIETDRWTLTAFVKNVGNVIAVTYLANETTAGLLVSPVGGSGPQSASVTTPRTIGVEFTANF